MQPLIKLALVLASIFATTFIIFKLGGILSVEQIEQWLVDAKNQNVNVIASIILLLLISDLFVAVPTLTVIILGGYFLGHTYGAIVSIAGLSIAGALGYTLSYGFGDKLEKWVIKNSDERQRMHSNFKKYGVFMLLFSRAMPILPEVCACLSGITRMPFLKFFAIWQISTVPYAVIASYAGSISSIDSPKPAIIAAIGLTSFFWLAWAIFQRVKK
ncbi:TVP38/TMEM64 family protein [Agaribacter marinus]|uniref:VTT domain-containing protein n=1 Tax=Agaribacter marinus TaxID=1431249 RepID=A0AA37T1L1_9ALTE|nr:VTT domain-containing protein [Agaribacter marinus]GLR72165.1 hypothetical protein GCM10007852_30730 [Agaribacter marinus]